MSNTRKIFTENFYATTLTEEISTLGDVSFEVATPPINTRGFIIVDPENSLLREPMYYHNVVGNRIYVYGANRGNPKLHDDNATVQINDVAELFNYISSQLSTTFNIEKIGGLVVKVWGGPVLKENIEISVLDTDLELANNSTNYICYDYENNEITTSLTEENIVVAEIITASGDITTINYRHYKFSINGIKSPYDVAVENGFIGTEEEWLETLRGPAGDIAEANPGEEQEIADNALIPTGSTVTTDDITYIKVTLSNGDYTQYNLGNIITGDSEGNIYSVELKTGSFGDDGITYEDGLFVNKITGYSSFSGNVMYKNQTNNVEGVNIFNNTTIFKGQAVFRYYTSSENTVFDANLGTKQGFNFASGGAKTLTFENLLAGNTLVFSIVVTVNPITLDIGTATGYGVDGEQASFTPYVIGDDTYPLTLEVGVHMFVAEVFSTGIHISYVGESTAI